jgi:cell division septal protein FtsQ
MADEETKEELKKIQKHMGLGMMFASISMLGLFIMFLAVVAFIAFMLL